MNVRPIFLTHILAYLSSLMAVLGTFIVFAFGATNSTTASQTTVASLITPETSAFIGVFLGILGRTGLQYLQAAKGSSAPLKFDSHFLYTAIITVLVSGVSAILLFPQFTINTTGGIFAIFIAAFGWAYSLNDILNNFISGSPSSPPSAPASAPAT